MSIERNLFGYGMWEADAHVLSMPLSGPMRKVLRACAISGSPTKIGSATIAALRARGIFVEQGRLTGDGYVTAIGLLPLAEQCRVLNIPLERIKCSWSARPEDAAVELVGRASEWAFADEGRTFCAMIHALVLPRLYSLTSAVWSKCDGSDHARSYFHLHYAGYLELLEAQPNLTDLMLEDIENVSISSFETSWSMLAQWNHRSTHPTARIDVHLATRILESIGRRILYEVAIRTFENPYAFWCGWPDITICRRSGRLRLVEVKTTDRLHASQIRTFVSLRDYVGLDIGVLQLVRAHGQNH